MSGKKLGIINPDEHLFSDESARRTGKRLDFEKHPPTITYHKDVERVLREVLNTDPVEGRCNGTVFRFTFRKEASKLSETKYNEERVKDLFQAFKTEGHLALMFLKNLAKIEFYARAKGSNSAKLLSSFSVHPDNNENPRSEECKFMNDVKKAHIDNSAATLHLVNNVTIESIINDDASATTKTQRVPYIIVHFYGGELLQKEHEFISEKQAKDLGLIPLVGLAYRLSEEQSTDGHIYCALPLPVIEEKVTGLSVHVNGYFALGPDRKDLKWPSTEQDTSNDNDISWNMFLLQKVLPPAYKELFHHLKMTHSTADVVYNALPDLNEVDSKWKKVADKVLSKVFEEECVWSDAVSKWMPLKDAYFVEKSKSGHEAATVFLKECSFPIAYIPEHTMQNLRMQNVKVNEVSPKVLQDVIAEHKDKLDHLPDTDRIDMLSYMLQDPLDIRNLFGVPIVPLENGEFACPPRSSNGSLFITSAEHSKDLVPGCENKVIKTGIKKDVLKIIKELATNSE